MSPQPAAQGGLRKLFLVSIVLLTTLTAVVGIDPVAAADDDINPPIESVLCQQPGEITVRLYRLFFGRVPDGAGLEYWSDIFSQTQDPFAIARWMSEGPEYQSLWAEVSDEEFVEGLLYQNLLSRRPDEAGFNYWVSFLKETPTVPAISREEMAVYWVTQPELTRKHPVTQPAPCSLLDDVVAIPGGRAVEFDYLTTDLTASSHRCRVVSINANWVHRDGPVPFSEHIGFASIDGTPLPSRNNVGDDNSRGILGSRRIGQGGEVSEFSAKFADDVGYINILSNLVQKDNSMLQLHANFWDENPGTPWYDPTKWDGKEEGWDWAVGGISMVVDGDYNVETAGQDHTFNTTRHSFVAFKAPSTVMLGSTTSMTAHEMVQWLDAQGYKDIMKMDGGGSVEFNEAGTATVAGTTRPLPVWLGVGC
ncbi:MAG: DUF4214 domain-containing protein [Acidimicrobiales bacterium]|nr:DUF4214 domain-containing protein [Acidimicrobiales bacterium]